MYTYGFIDTPTNRTIFRPTYAHPIYAIQATYGQQQQLVIHDKIPVYVVPEVIVAAIHNKPSHRDTQGKEHLSSSCLPYLCAINKTNPQLHTYSTAAIFPSKPLFE